MTREDIIKAMGESGVGTMLLGVQHDKAVERLTRFAALVFTAEREACAKACDEASLRFHALWEKFEYSEDQSMSIAASQCAAAIRARSQS